MRVTAKAHPVADQRGRVRVHRAVLFDAIGPGPHDCQWCEWPGLRWDVERSDPSYLVVDHVDGDGYNNVRSNLVPAHAWCNNYRSIIVELGIPWSTFRDVPPADRPPLRVTYNGAPTKAALDLARSALAEPASELVKPAAPVVAAPASADGWVVWADVLDEKELAKGNIRLRPPPAELLEKYPQLRSIDFGTFGR